MKKLGHFACILLLCCCKASGGTIFIEPPDVTVHGDVFSVDVNVSGVSDLFAFQFNIVFDPANLSALSVTEGELFASVGVFFAPSIFPGAITDISDSLSGLGPGISADGTLASITFQVIGFGSTNVAITDVVLLDSNLNDISAITHGGTVTVPIPVPDPAPYALVSTALGAIAIARRRCRRRLTG